MRHPLKTRKPAVVGLIATLALVLVTVHTTSAAYADVVLQIPRQSPGGPFYARVSDGAVPHTDQWAAVVFYRDPACVPPDFNLLNFFDPPPRPFGCRLTVAGFERWKNGPGQDPAPLVTKLREAGPVPVWFVSWPVLEAAMADGVLTITELAGLPTLMTGVASQFSETLQPVGGGRRTSFIQLTASGTLSDGRSFRVRFTAVVPAGNPSAITFEHVTIQFR